MINKDHGREMVQFTEELPVHAPLTTDEFKKLSAARLGLRTTSPGRVEEERYNGVEGDYIILSDLEGFLKINEAAVSGLKVYEREALIGHILREEPNARAGIHDLDGLDTLPDRYTQALHRFFFQKAVPATPGPPIRRDTTLSQLLNEQAFPALLLIRDDQTGGYDSDMYYGFNKKGKDRIRSSDILDNAGLDMGDYSLLIRRYEPYLDQPVHQRGLFPSSPDSILGRQVDNDISTLLVGKTIDLIRKHIS